MSSDSAKKEGPPKHSRLSAGATTELYLNNRGKLKASEPKENYKSTFNQTILDCIKDCIQSTSQRTGKYL